MKAKYDGHCQYCPDPVIAGDEIVRGNGGRHALYSHSRCVPSAGVLNRARFAVVVTVADEKGWIPVGECKRYVHRGPADAMALSLCGLGATAEVRALG